MHLCQILFSENPFDKGPCINTVNTVNTVQFICRCSLNPGNVKVSWKFKNISR